MPSPGYGENGSVVGPQNLPTSSAASGVWSLGEMTEAQRDGIWPNLPTGWIAVPTASNFNGVLGSHSLDSNNNLWFAIHQGDTANSDGPLGVILSDGTIGDANDWKYIDAQNSRPAYTQGICINGSKMFTMLQCSNVSNIQATFTCGFTPGTLGPDYNKSWYENNTRDFYCGNAGSIQTFDSDSNAIVGYGLNTGYNRFHVYVSLISTTTGVAQVLNGSSADTILFESNSGANSVYPVLSRNCKVGDYIVVQVRYQADRVGWIAQNTTNSTAYRQYYTDSGGTLNYKYGGITADTQSTSHFYMTTHNGGNFAQLSRVQLSNGSLAWNRKIQATTSPSSISSCSQPVVDSSGNIYFAWAQYDNNASVVDTAYRIHWVKYDSSGNVQQIDSQNTRCLFLSPEHGQAIYNLNVSLDSNEEFIYITAYNNANTPIAAKLPLDGSGTQTAAFSVGGKSFYYRNDVATTDSAGTLTAAGTDGSYATNTETTQSDTLYNATAQITGAAVASIEVD